MILYIAEALAFRTNHLTGVSWWVGIEKGSDYAVIIELRQEMIRSQRVVKRRIHRAELASAVAAKPLVDYVIENMVRELRA